MMNTFLFYDIETTGLNKAFDQVLQFAAIRTDLSLKELERYSVVVSLRPDVIPSPLASVTHRISIADAMEGMCEVEATRHIHALLNQAGTISLGYNTLGFDDEFLRFSFHRNLLPPYTHQYANGCGRMDMLPVAVMYRLYKPGVIQWPEIDGRMTLKLEHLSSANSLAAGQAHDAMVDVEATLELARRFYKEREMWDYILGYFDKKTDKMRLDKLAGVMQSSAGIHPMGIMTGSEFGPDNHYQAPVLYIGNSRPYSNQGLWLRLDLPELAETTPEDIDEKSWIIRKRTGEPGIVLPTAERFMKHMDGARKETMEKNLKWLEDHPELFARIIKYHSEFKYPEVPNLDIDAALYQNGFLSRVEQQVCDKFHRCDPESLSDFMNQIASQRVREQAQRVVFRNYPEFSDDRTIDLYEKYMEVVNPESEEGAMVDYRGKKRTTPAGAMAEIQRVREEDKPDPEQTELLDELEAYLCSNF